MMVFQTKLLCVCLLQISCFLIKQTDKNMNPRKEKERGDPNKPVIPDFVYEI